jgi:probable addiction module antidote protein
MEMTTKTRVFDPATYLDSDMARAAYLTEAFETGDVAFIADALGVVARAQGMTRVARETDLSREALYRALSQDGNPELATVLKVTAALGLKLTVEPALPSPQDAVAS